MNYLDFAPGYKTIAGIIILILSLAGSQIGEAEVLEAVTGVGQAIGVALTAYGLVMKIARQLKEKN